MLGLSAVTLGIAAPLSCSHEASSKAAGKDEPGVDVREPPKAGSSPWGPDDEIGAANRLGPELVQKAAKLITAGKTYSLGMEVNGETPAFGHRSFRLYMTEPDNPGGKPIGGNHLTYNDDMIEAWMGVGTQLNGLGHVGIDNVFYNGNKEADLLTVHGLKKLGLEKVPPMVTRGVMLDMAAHLGTDIVKEGTAIGAADIEAMAREEHVTIEQGDVVLFHTGWLDLVGKDNKRFMAGAPGINRDAARYLADKGIVAVGTDTWPVEVIPFEPGAGTFEVDQWLLVKKGIYVLENIVDAALAKDKVYEFMFVLGHPKMTGTVQSIINPIAIR